MIHTVSPQQFRLQIQMNGLVQGQGVRPTIARIAASFGVTGTVRNASSGVMIDAVGDASLIETFQCRVRDSFPEATFVAQIAENSDSPPQDSFHIIESETGGKLRTTVPVDLGICADCVAEVRSPIDRRRGYPFTTCTVCGPRFSILAQMPFDRKRTTMSRFPMCEACEREYCDPQDRRFHAQTIACPDCGPRCWVTDSNGITVADYKDSIQLVAERLLAGGIVAVKGIGGYQLICDATNDDAVNRLRQRKRRPTKPLPVMVGDMDQAREIAFINACEQELLQSPANPIVLLRQAEIASLAPSLSPGLNTVGVLLPSSALHVLLIDLVGRPLVITSGNMHGSPLIYQNGVVTRELASIAEVLLHHDREIAYPIDDSVVQCIGDRPMTMRAARGIAPLTLNGADGTAMLAIGGHQKVAPAIQTSSGMVLAPHIGDMESEECRIRFEQSVARLQSLYSLSLTALIHDRHPNYFTTNWASCQSQSQASVQHHHAHIVAAMLEHDLLDQSVLGIAFDGTGYGDDGTIWGGEVLLASRSSYKRVGHLRPFRLPGGEQAVKQPWRIAASLRSQVSEIDDAPLQIAIDRGPVTSSTGRLFDGIAAIVLGIDEVSFEGEAAMRLEAACDANELSTYEFTVSDAEPFQIDWRPVLIAITNDVKHESPGRIAMKFHRAVATLIVLLAERYSEVPSILCGGAFQNRVLVELVQEIADATSIDIRMPGQIPINDGGLAIGQLAIAQGTSSCV